MATGDADAYASTIMGQVAALGVAVTENATEVAEAEAELSKVILSDGSLTRMNLANAERDLQNRIHDTRLEALKTNTELSRYLADKTDAVKERLTGFERNVDMQFQSASIIAEKNTRLLTEKLDAIERRSLKDELDETRLELLSGKSASNFALQNQEIASLKNMINSVEQTQRFSSKTVQFGAGNVAIPTQTANQG